MQIDHRHGWPGFAHPTGSVALHLPGAEHKTVRNLSAGTRIGDALFLTADEFGTVLRLAPEHDRWGRSARFDLCDLLPLRDPDEEIDLEGLAADDDWLWLVGSHARTRAKPEKFDDCIDLDRLSDLKDTRARCLLARVPLVTIDGLPTPVARDGERRAGMIKQAKHGSALARALHAHPLIGPFTRIPAKEGGVDVEGIAVCGDRVALGMRGPVVATHAVLIEARLEYRKSGALKLADTLAPRLLALEGLGIRDLKRHGDDLLILAGPTTGLSGPCALYRWRDWANDPAQDTRKVRLHRPERIVELPFGRGVDHPEGLALWPEDADGAQVLVIFDSPDEARIDPARGTITADLFRLPR